MTEALKEDSRQMRNGACHIGLVILGAFLAATAGCAGNARQRALGVELEVDDVRFEGVERFEHDELLDYLYLSETSWVPFSEPAYLSKALVAVDAERIVELYASFGYYDAEVLGIWTVPDGEDEVDVIVRIEEGRPTRVEEIAIDWEVPPQGPLEPAEKREVAEACRLEVGEPFEVERLNRSKSGMREELRRRGFSEGKVDAEARVDRETREARVRFTLKPGPRAEIGDIEFKGLGYVPEYLAQREVSFARGKPFSPSMLHKMEKALFGMDVFTSITAREEKVDPDGRVKVVISVIESEPQSVRVGVGLGLSPQRWEERVSTRYSHRNIFGHLTRLDLDLRLGYAELPALYDVEEHGPILEVGPTLRKKGWLEKRLVWSFGPGFKIDIAEGYQYYSPSNRVGVSRFFGRILRLGLSHNIEYYDFFSVSPTIDANRSVLGLDFKDPYLISYGELEATVYLVDDMLAPRNGVVFDTRYMIAGGPFLGDFDFFKLSGELRGYWTIVERIQLAARIGSGWILPYGKRPGAPINLKFYLGGADTVRGYGYRRLSPKTRLCPEDESSCQSVPVGGHTEILGNLELRGRVWKELYLAGFLDAGDVRSGELEYRLGELSYATGGGVRYDSIIGKFRLDVGVILNETELSRGERGWAFYLALGEAF